MRLLRRVALLMFCVAGATHADAVSVANRLRFKECGSHSARLTPFKEDPQIAAIAARWSQGGRLFQSIPQSYAQARFVSLQVSGVDDEPALANALRQQWCSALTDPDFTRFGVHRRGTDYWFVLATGDASPKANDIGTLRATALGLVNEARAHNRRCGLRFFKPTPPLKSNELLNRAAEAHARNMAQHRQLQHEGFDGSTPGDRARAAGYAWRAIAENVAAGPTTAVDVVNLWLESPGHCANIMSPDYTEMGLAFATDRDGTSGVYWAQEFGRPR